MRLWLLVSIVCVQASASTATDRDVPRIRLACRPAWVIDDQDASVLLGRVSDVQCDEAGLVYIVDSQLSHVLVLNSSGELVRTIGRDGRGPGELIRPFFVSVQAGQVCVVERYPGTLNWFAADGTWRSRVLVSTGDDERVGVGRVLSAHTGLHVFGTARGRREDRGYTRPFMARVGPDGIVGSVFIEEEAPYDPRAIDHREAAVDLSASRIAVDQRGWIFVASRRHAFHIEVWDSTGTPCGAIRRSLPPRRRPPDDMARREAAKPIGFPGTITLDDFDATIDRMESIGRSLWVLTAYGTHPTERDVFQSWERFDERDRYEEVGDPDAIIDIRLHANRLTDRLFLLGQSRVVLVRNHMDTAGGNGVESEGERRLECYDLIPE